MTCRAILAALSGARMFCYAQQSSRVFWQPADMKLAGILLIVLGIAGLIYQGITYTSRETVLEIGPIEATAETEKTMPISPVVSGVAVVVGLGLLVGSRRK